MRRSLIFVCVLCVGWRLEAQPPAIGQNGVVNQASQIVPSLAGGVLARGARIEVRGVRLVAGDGKTAVVLHHGDSNIPLTILSAGATLILANIPQDAPLGAATLTVIANGSSVLFPVEIATSNPGLYSRNGEG